MIRTLFFFFLLGLTLFSSACKKDIALPVFDVADVDVPALAQNNVDQNRLCLAEVLTQLLAEENFRSYLQEQSIHAGQDWNKEFLLVHHLEEVIFSDQTLLDLVAEQIEAGASSCFASRQDFVAGLLSDPLLVLKVPDVIPAEEWDVTQTVPFLYTKTTELVQYPLHLEQGAGMIGLHASGAVDTYLHELPTYFPLVLKHSEDYVAINDELKLYNGADFSAYHTAIPPSVYGAAFFETLARIPDSDFRIIPLTELMNFIFSQRDDVFEPYVGTPCPGECDNDCIPQSERRLLATALGMDIRNELSIEQYFSAVLRPGGRFILTDNITPLAVGRQLSEATPYLWQRTMFGSFRLAELFSVSQSHRVNYERYTVNGKNAELPVFSYDFEVLHLNEIPLPNVQFAWDIADEDMYWVAGYRIALDIPTYEHDSLDEDPLSVYFTERDFVRNHALYCVPPTEIGFNSWSLTTSI